MATKDKLVTLEDLKVVHDEASDLKSALDNTNNIVEDIISDVYNVPSVSFTWVKGNISNNGTNSSVVWAIRTQYQDCSPGDRVLLDVVAGTRAAVFFYNGSTSLTGDGEGQIPFQTVSGSVGQVVAPATTTRFRVRAYKISDYEDLTDLDTEEKRAEVAAGVDIVMISDCKTDEIEPLKERVTAGFYVMPYNRNVLPQFSYSSSTLTVTLPENTALRVINLNTNTISLSGYLDGSYTITTEKCLVYNITDKDLTVKTLAERETNDIVLLATTGNGAIMGQWAPYYYTQRCVSFYSQTLDENQKTIARNNIGAADDDMLQSVIKMTGIDTDISSKFVFTQSSRINYSTGGVNTGSSYENYCSSSFVPVKGFDKIDISVPITSASTQHGLAFYDDTKTFISGSGVQCSYNDDPSSTELTEIKTVPVPTGAEYVRTTWWSTTGRGADETFLCTVIKEGKVSTGDELPEYYFTNNYLPGRIATINANRLTMSSHAIEFVWITDLHVFAQNGSMSNTMNSVKLCEYIARTANVSTVYCGGDLLRNQGNDGMTQADCMKLLGQIRNYLDPVWDHTYMIIGNHEWNEPAGAETPNRVIGSVAPLKMILMQESYKRGAKLVFGGKESPYGSYVVDDENLNVRTLFIGCDEGGLMSKAEYEWIAEVLRDTTSGQQVLVMSHVGLLASGTLDNGTSNISRFKYVAEMLEAALSKSNNFSFYIEKYSSGTKVNLQRVPSSPDVFDFSGCNFSLIGCIAGHNHRDTDMTTQGGTLMITTTCDQIDRARHGTVRKEKTITEQAFDVVQIDLDNKKIYMTRIGGSWDGTGALQNPDREFTFGT